MIDNLHVVYNVGGTAGHVGCFATYLVALGPDLELGVRSIAGPVTRTFSWVKLILGKRSTSFWTPAFFQSWSALMGIVLFNHCEGD